LGFLTNEELAELDAIANPVAPDALALANESGLGL
jgi:hypothetical protein